LGPSLGASWSAAGAGGIDAKARAAKLSEEKGMRLLRHPPLRHPSSRKDTVLLLLLLLQLLPRLQVSDDPTGRTATSSRRPAVSAEQLPWPTEGHALAARAARLYADGRARRAAIVRAVELSMVTTGLENLCRGCC
jgi:hypothetical protein